MQYTFEICANSVESVKAAIEGGAHRVELCAALPEGGTTPSYGTIKKARAVSLDKIKLNVIVRSRAGDFLYTDSELDIMCDDIKMAKDEGVDGVVIGALTADGLVDRHAMDRLVQAADGLSITFHRAFDMLKDPYKAIDTLIDYKIDRVLSSGQKANALLGAQNLKVFNDYAKGRIIFMAGCGVKGDNIQKIRDISNLHEFHFSAKGAIDSKMIYKNKDVTMSGPVFIDEYKIDVTLVDSVRKTIAALKA